MNAATQTPRRLYEAEKNLLLKLLIKKLEKLEQALKSQSSSSSDKNKPNGNQQIPTRNKKSNQIIQIGPNCTELSEKMYGKVNFSSYQTATRDLCYTIFGREVLATHTLSGRRGPGTVTQNKQAKEQLKPVSVEDIVQHVQSLFAVEQGQVLQVIRQVCRNSALAQKKKKK